MTSNLTVKIGADIQELQSKLSTATSSLNGFSKNLNNIAGSLGLAFGAREVVNFTIEISKLAGQAQAVQAAFDRLPNSVQLMKDLKAATGDTVTELDLMKRAVQANNFDIELAALPKLLQFATLRAQQTGQSVDYLVDSIVTGIGRKSKLILDNLGISAVALGDKLNGVSTEAATVGDVARAVGEIAEESLSNMATFSDNASTKMDKLAASWGNLKVNMGNKSGGPVGYLVDYLRQTIDLINNEDTNFVENWLTFISGPEVTAGVHKLEELRKHLKEIRAERERLANIGKTMPDIDPLTGMPTDGSGGSKWIKPEQLGLIETVRQKIAEITALREKAKTINDADAYTAQLKTLNAELDRLLGKQKAVKDKFAKKSAAFFDPEFIDVQNTKGNKTGDDFLKSVGLDPKSIDAGIKKIIASIKTLPPAVSEVHRQMIDLGPAISGLITDIASSIGDAFAGSKDFGIDLIKAVGKFCQQIGALFIAAGVGEAAFQSGNPYAMIAAGVALVAIGSAVNGMMQKQSQGSRAMASGGGSSGGGPGYRPSELKELKVAGRVRGYDLALTEEREAYRRKRVG